MLVGEFIQWWYRAGWLWYAQALRERLHRLALTFSVPILLRTLVSPWRRIISYGGGGLQGQLRAALDNTISRLVGLAVRLIVITTALMCMAVVATVGLIGLVLWALAPFLGLGLVVRGLLAW